MTYEPLQFLAMTCADIGADVYASLYYVSLGLTLACVVFRMLLIGRDEFAEGSY